MVMSVVGCQVRLLLSREFHLEDTMVLWDAIFAESEDLSLIE